jgi:hypothetical protein
MLQSFNLLRQGRLGDIQASSGAAEAAFHRNRVKRPQMLVVRRQSGSRVSKANYRLNFSIYIKSVSLL